MTGLELYIYVDDIVYGIDLFKDESISLNSSIQNSSDIAKTFTDYSQTFTIPASNRNNGIFRYWYENSVENGYDQRLRYNAYIELNTQFFRSGKIQLEKANIKNGVIDSYSITFYGNLTQLKDKFGEDRLNGLTYSSIAHTYSGTEVLTRMTSTASYDVRYPIIGANTRYEYKTGAALYDVTISSTTSCIRYDSLFPAVRVAKIMDFIENKYDIDFTGSWLSDPLYTNLYLYAKNAEILKPFGTEGVINFGTHSFIAPFPTPAPSFNLTTDTLTTPSYTTYDGGKPVEYQSSILASISISSSSAISYVVNVYKNGLLFITSPQYINNSGFSFASYVAAITPTPNDTYYITISSIGPMNYTAILEWEYTEWDFDATLGWIPNIVYYYTASTTSTQTTSGLIDVKNYVPDMKVADFFTGIVKMFNLIVDPLDDRTFNLLPLETYYTTGVIKDLTKYVITDSLTLDRSKLYKKINFTYEDSKNVLNNAFDTTTAQVRGYKYGNLSFEDQYTNDSQTYEVKAGFEDVIWERAATATQSYNFMSATMWDKDFKPYIPKPILMYYNGQETLVTGTTNTLKISLSPNGAGITQSSKYIRFSNEYNLLGNTSSDISQVHSLNWGNEISSWYLSNIEASLYEDNYSNYINNIYDIKTRLFKVKMILPTTVLADIKLNDRIIIRDKRYLINNMNSNLNTGVVDFDLVTDNRIVT
jgi:hypothetical protein